MNRPTHQLIIKYAGWIVTGTVFVSSFIEVLSNLILIPESITYLGTLIVMLFGLISNLFIKKYPILWVTDEGQQIRITSLSLGNWIIMAGVIIALWVPRIMNFGTNSPPIFQSELIIYADSDWQNTGFFVKSGEIVEITYKSGTWSVDGNDYYDGSGQRNGYICSNFISVEKCVERVPNGVKGSLVMRIGGTSFPVGNHVLFTSTTSGYLELSINDTNDIKDLQDNRGNITVEVAVRSP